MDAAKRLHSQFSGSEEIATMEVVDFDDLDLSFAAEQHEIDCCLPSLVDSFTSEESRRVIGSTSSDMDEDGSVQQWKSLAETTNDQNLPSPIRDIQWTPPPLSVVEKQSHHSRGAARMQSMKFWSCNSEAFATIMTSADSDDEEEAPMDIQWCPAPSSADVCDTSSFVSARSTETFQAEYERSRQKLVASMIRSQETRLYVQKLKSQSNLFQPAAMKEDSLSPTVAMKEDSRMFSSPWDSNVTEV